MNEMIYGNTGKRDEGINIDMDQALYQKLQSRTFVPKLKSMLNDRLQEGDKNFVFIGEVVDKAGNFSVYGYNAKLESDSRGGDYGHYVAVPVNEKAVAVDTNSIGFLTEEGFVEYVNLKTLNDDKRFKITPQSIDIDVNAKKRIVNNLMETFMKVRKRKNVTFSFDDCSVEEFTAKSLYVLCDLMKYLPFRMRKNISFISHVASNQKLPDMINLAAYPASSEFKPHDCITLNAGAPFGNDGIFSAYVEKVFAMSDAERDSYFEKIHEDIEKPALEKGVDVKADLYLLDVSTKELWTDGDIKEAISSIFNSVSDVLVVYPLFTELAKNRLSSNENEVVEYLKSRIDETKNTDELKSVFTNLIDVYNATKFDMNTNVNELFKTHANGFIEAANSDDDIVKVASGIVSIGTDVLDQEFARDKFLANMDKKNDINGIYTFYLKLKEKKFIDAHELNICLTESVEKLILRVTDRYSEAKEKLSALEKMYSEFQAACTSKDYPHVKEVYDAYKNKFSSGANAAAVSKGNDIIYDIEREIKGYCTFLDVKNCIIKLAEVEVKANESLKQKACDIYRRISNKMFDELRNERLNYGEFKKLIQEIGPSVKKLNENEVYDDQLRSGWGQEKYVPNGMYRFVTFFESLINTVGPAGSLTEALLGVETTREQVRDESTLLKMFEKFAPAVLMNWMDKNKKYCNEGAFKKAEKELKKNFDKRLSHTVRDMFEYCLDKQNSKKKGGKISIVKLAIVGVVVLAILGGLVFGGIKLFGWIFGDKDPQVETDSPSVMTEYYVSDAEINAVKDYIAGFAHEDLKNAELVIGKLSKTVPEATDDKEKESQKVVYTVTITNPLGSADFKEMITVDIAKTHKSKSDCNVDEIDENKDYAFVLQASKDGEKVYLRDLYEVPPDFTGYNFDAKAPGNIGDVEFYGSILRYIGTKMELVVVGEPPMTTEEEVEMDEQKQKEEGSDEEETEESKQTEQPEQKPEANGTGAEQTGTGSEGDTNNNSGNSSTRSSSGQAA